MKISPAAQGVASSKSTETADRARTQQSNSKQGPASTGSDSVKLSQVSTHLQAIESTLAVPQFDQAKVEEIKRAITNGSLTINPEVIADKMLASVQEWLAKKN